MIPSIRLKCHCGAEGEWRGGVYINPDGKKNEKGQVFLIELRAQEWLANHDCKNKVFK